jgi:hypothetical protein
MADSEMFAPPSSKLRKTQKMARLLPRINDLRDASEAWVEALNGGE